MDEMLRALIEAYLSPLTIFKDGRVTTVFWKDRSTTIVKLREGERDDDYTAFCAAMAKKVFGSNNAIKRKIMPPEIESCDMTLDVNMEVYTRYIMLARKRGGGVRAQDIMRNVLNMYIIDQGVRDEFNLFDGSDIPV